MIRAAARADKVNGPVGQEARAEESGCSPPGHGGWSGDRIAGLPLVQLRVRVHAVPLGGNLVCTADGNQRRLGKGPSYDLDAYGEPCLRETAGHRQRRQAGASAAGLV